MTGHVDDDLVEVAKDTVVEFDRREIVVLICEGCTGMIRPEGVTTVQAYERLYEPDVDVGAIEGFERSAAKVMAYIERQLRSVALRRH